MELSCCLSAVALTSAVSHQPYRIISHHASIACFVLAAARCFSFFLLCVVVVVVVVVVVCVCCRFVYYKSLRSHPAPEDSNYVVHVSCWLEFDVCVVLK